MRKIPDPRLHDSCNPKVRDPSLPVVTEYRPTANGLGKLYRMEPGKRVVLDSIEDQWEWNDVEDMADQDYRVSFSPAMSEHLMKVRDRLWAEYSTHPLYAARFNEPGFFESLPTSMGQVR